MGKKKHRNQAAVPRERGGRAGFLWRSARWPVALLGILVLGVGAYAYQNSPSPSPRSVRVRHWVPGGERRRTLDPALFGGVVARAYRVAREIPEVLDKLYCYCYCIENMGHRSNLSCFVGRHAAGCDVCVQQALTASEMTKQGKSVAEIQEELDRRFG